MHSSSSSNSLDLDSSSSSSSSFHPFSAPFFKENLPHHRPAATACRNPLFGKTDELVRRNFIRSRPAPCFPDSSVDSSPSPSSSMATHPSIVQADASSSRSE